MKKVETIRFSPFWKTTLRYGTSLILVLTAEKLVAQSSQLDVSQTGASSIDFSRSSEETGGVEGKTPKGAYVVKSDLLDALKISSDEFAKLSPAEIQSLLRTIYKIPKGEEFQLIMADSPEEALFKGSVSPVALKVSEAFYKYMTINKKVANKFVAHFKDKDNFNFSIHFTLSAEENDPCFSVSNPAYSYTTEQEAISVFCINNLKYISNLFITMAIAPLIERKYLPNGILPVLQLYNKSMERVKTARLLNQDDPLVPCDVISYLYVSVVHRATDQCDTPTARLQLAARNWFGTVDGTWVMDIPFLHNALARDELPGVTLKLRARSIEDSFYAFVLLHEIGHILDSSPEGDVGDAEEKADRFAFDVISEMPELYSERLTIHPALQVYFMHLRSTILAEGGFEKDLAVIDKRYEKSFRYYVEAEQASFRVAQNSKTISARDFAYRQSEFCWTMHLRKNCQPKEALQRPFPRIPGR